MFDLKNRDRDTAEIEKDGRLSEMQAMLLFALGTFLYSSTAVHFILENAAELPLIQQRFYDAAGYICIAGFLVYALGISRQPRKSRTAVLFLLGFLYIAGTACSLIRPGSGLLITARTVCIFVSAVFLGAAYHEDVLLMETHAGGYTAAGFILAYGLQYFLIIRNRSALLHFLLLVVGAALFLLVIRTIGTENEDRAGSPENEPQPIHGKLTLKDWLLPGAMVAILVFLHLYFDRNLSLLSYETAYQEYNIFGWPRLISLIGALAAGAVWDYRNGRYFPLYVVLLSFVTILNIVFFDSGRFGFLANMCLAYFCLGSVLMFLIFAFRELALRSDNPGFRAIQGRVIEKLTDAAGIFLLFHISFAGVVAMQLLAMAAGVTMAFFWHEKTAAGSGSESIALQMSPALDETERTNLFSEKYGLTEREKEVLERLLTTEETGQEMAEALCISRRVLQRHIASLYEKTGTKTRMGLVSIYYRDGAEALTAGSGRKQGR